MRFRRVFKHTNAVDMRSNMFYVGMKNAIGSVWERETAVWVYSASNRSMSSCLL